MENLGTRTRFSPTAPAQPLQTTHSTPSVPVTIRQPWKEPTPPEIAALSSDQLSAKFYELTHELNRLSQLAHDRPADYHAITKERDAVRSERAAIRRELHARGQTELDSPFVADWIVTLRVDGKVVAERQVTCDYFASRPGHNGHGHPTLRERLWNTERAWATFYEVTGIERPKGDHWMGAKFIRSRRKVSA